MGVGVLIKEKEMKYEEGELVKVVMLGGEEFLATIRGISITLPELTLWIVQSEEFIQTQNYGYSCIAIPESSIRKFDEKLDIS